MAKDEPLKITLDDLEPEATVRPEVTPSSVQDKVGATGRTFADAARDLAGKATDKLTSSATEATSRTAEMAREKVGEAIQEQSKAIVDAVEERVREHAQKGAEGGLRWLSDRLTLLADRVKDQPITKDTPDKPPSTPEK